MEDPYQRLYRCCTYWSIQLSVDERMDSCLEDKRRCLKLRRLNVASCCRQGSKCDTSGRTGFGDMRGCRQLERAVISAIS
jgi:hypothetical protein